MYALLSWLGEWVELPRECGVERGESGRARQASAGAREMRAARELADALTNVGLAVDGVEALEIEGAWEIRLELDVTSNRPDCLGHLGIARELSAILDRPLSVPDLPPGDWLEGDRGAGPVRIEDPEGCDRYAALVVRDLKIGPSPDWLRRRLLAVGQRPIHNVVDATNYVLFELGQPLHAFDWDRIEGPEIRVRRARAGERLRTLDGVDRELGSETLVIADRLRPVALAGILGGEATAVTGATRAVLLESAHFQPGLVRRGARRLGLHTDASHRFERGTDPEICRLAALRCAALLREAAGGRIVEPGFEVRTGERRRLRWELDCDRLARFSGKALDEETVRRILTRLGFEPVSVRPGLLSGFVPSFRGPDFTPRPGPSGEPLAEAQDLYEEVLRHVGFDGLPSTLPSLGGADPGGSGAEKRRRKVQDLLASFGFAETISWSFQSVEQDRRFPKLCGDGRPVELANPLSERHAVLRRSLVPQLVEAALHNLRHEQRRVRLFEVGSLFSSAEAEELEAVALVAGGRSEILWDREPEIDLFHVKGWGEALFQLLGVEGLRSEPAELAGVASGTGGWWRSPAGTPLGWFGRILEEESPIPLFVAEALLSGLELGSPRRVEAPPRLPGISADYTLVHPAGVRWQAVAGELGAWVRPPLERFVLLERYRGPQLPPDCVATTIRCFYRAPDRALTQDEVNAVHAQLALHLEGRFGRKEDR